MSSYDLIVVGAGPVGLSLALGLSRRGRRVLVLEKNTTTAEHSRAPAIWPGTQEVLADLEVIDAFLKDGIVIGRLQLWDVDREAVLLSIDLAELAAVTPYPHLLILPQSRGERLLLDALGRQSSAEVRFSSEVIDVRQTPGAVDVRVRGPKGEFSVTAMFVAGCDGAHSIVREKIGARLEGSTYGMRAALADIELSGGNELRSPRITTQPGIAIGIRIRSGLWRMILPFAEEGGVQLDQRIRSAAHCLFRGLGWRPVWQSEFGLHNRVSTAFAHGRVVLAGDAAHLNSPVGGQGMNSGIQDAALLVDVILEALVQGESQPFGSFASARKQGIQEGVNRFTDLLTRVLLAGKGRFIRPALSLMNAALGVPAVRRRALRRVAMLGPNRLAL